MSQDLLKIFDNPINFLKFTGAWIDQDVSKKKIVFAIIAHIILIDFTIVTQFVYLMTVEKLEEFAETFTMLLSFVSVFVETLSLIPTKERINLLLTELKNLISFMEIHDKQDGNLKTRITQANVIFKINLGMIVVMSVSSAVYSVIKCELPYGTWFPWDHKENLLAFCFMSLVETFGITTYWISICIETLPLFFISFMTGLTEELAEKFSTLSSRKSFKVDVEKNSRLDHLKTIYLLEKDIENRKSLELRKFIEIQQKIKEIVKKVGATFQTVLVVKGILTILKLCMASFAIITVNNNFFKQLDIKFIKTFYRSQKKETAIVLRLIFFMIPMTLQMLLPCYISTELTVAYEKLSMKLFHTEWMNESRDFKKNLKVFFENSKKPLKIVVLKIFHLNLENFVKIINSAYSLFAVLRGIND
jgi:hypothetical protein